MGDNSFLADTQNAMGIEGLMGPNPYLQYTGQIPMAGYYTGQGGAISPGGARALKSMYGLTTATEPTEDGKESTSGGMAKRLRDSGFLTRDGRMKERKKYGRKGARKSFQFSKR